ASEPFPHSKGLVHVLLDMALSIKKWQRFAERHGVGTGCDIDIRSFSPPASKPVAAPAAPQQLLSHGLNTALAWSLDLSSSDRNTCGGCADSHGGHRFLDTLARFRPARPVFSRLLRFLPTKRKFHDGRSASDNPTQLAQSASTRPVRPGRLG